MVSVTKGTVKMLEMTSACGNDFLFLSYLFKYVCIIRLVRKVDDNCFEKYKIAVINNRSHTVLDECDPKTSQELRKLPYTSYLESQD